MKIKLMRMYGNFYLRVVMQMDLQQLNINRYKNSLIFELCMWLLWFLGLCVPVSQGPQVYRSVGPLVSWSMGLLVLFILVHSILGSPIVCLDVYVPGYWVITSMSLLVISFLDHSIHGSLFASVPVSLGAWFPVSLCPSLLVSLCS